MSGYGPEGWGFESSRAYYSKDHVLMRGILICIALCEIKKPSKKHLFLLKFTFYFKFAYDMALFLYFGEQLCSRGKTEINKQLIATGVVYQMRSST